jgi:Uma2 family endonuclease
MLGSLLSLYDMSTPGCCGGMTGTWFMSERFVAQPDLTMEILPEYGGQSRVWGEYSAGAPEMIIEVSLTGDSRDFGVKKEFYESLAVREYLIALPVERRLAAFELTAAGFRPLESAPDGIFRSVFFPGLWLDTEAVWNRDMPRMKATLQQGLATPEHAEFVAKLERRKR